MNLRNIKILSFEISRATLSVFLLTLLSCILLIVRIIKTEELKSLSLLWNLFLAWIPLFFVLIARRISQFPNNKSFFNKAIIYANLGLWLLFFPNSPYLITDLIHIEDYNSPILWYDAFAFFIAALAGTATGLYSLFVAHQTFNKLMTSLGAWISILASILISGFGLYLGRFVRFNSWDLFINPFILLKTSINELQNPLALQTTMVFSLVVVVLYVALIVLIPVSSHAGKKNVA